MAWDTLITTEILNQRVRDTRVSTEVSKVFHKTKLISDLKVHLSAVSSISIPEPWETEAGKYLEFEANSGI